MYKSFQNRWNKMFLFYLCVSLVCSLCSSFGYGFMEISRGLHNVHLAYNFIESPHRVKRSDYKCALTCLSVMKINMDKYLPQMDQTTDRLKSDPTTLMAFSKPQFQSLCQNVVIPAISCVDKCPSSSASSNFVTKFMKSFCVDHFNEYYDNFDCLEKARNISKTECEDGSCKKFNQAIKLQENGMTQSQDVNSLKSQMAAVCEDMSCEMQCKKPIITKTCNENLATLICNDLFGQMMKNMKEMMESAGVQNSVWPSKCDKILIDTGYGSAADKPAEVLALVTLLVALLMQLR